MNEYNFEDILNRRQKGTIKWDAKSINERFKVNISNDDEIFPMFIADLDFKLGQEIIDALKAHFAIPDFGYYNIQDSYYEAVINWHQNKHNLKLSKEWIIPTCGTVTSLRILSELLGKNKNFLVLTPVYRRFETCCHAGKMYTLPLIYQECRYYIDFEKLEETIIDNHIELIIFCNPHNPGGRLWTKDELEKVVDICKRHDVYLIVDEIHADIVVAEQKFVSMMNFADEYAKIVVATSANKTFAISGLSSSYLLTANAEIRDLYNNYISDMHLEPNRFGVEVTEILYRYGSNWHEAMQDTVKHNIKMLNDILNDTALEIMPTDAGYLVWLKVDDRVDVEELIDNLASRANVFLESGSRFIANYHGFIRINVATAPSLVKEAMLRFKKIYLEMLNK